MDSFERLRAADPMRGVDPHMSQIKAQVMAQTTSHVGQRRGLPTLAIAAALVVIAGAAGAFAGRMSAPQDIAALPQVPVMGNGGGATTNAEQKDSMAVRGGYFGGGRMVLKPTAGISNVAGTAKAYRLMAKDVDPVELAKKVALVIGAEGDVRNEGQSLSVGSQDGSGPTVWLSVDSLVSFSASNPQKSPWQCVKSEPSGATSTSPQECAQPNYKAPSFADAIRQVREVFTAIGLNLKGVDFTAAGDNTSVNVQAWTVIDGKRIALNWYADVSEKGVYSFSANAASLEALPDYPIIGARDAALRTTDPRWSTMGPTYVSGPDSGNGMVMPMVTDQEAPPTVIKQGRPAIPVYSSSVEVNSATQGLLQQWLSDQVVLLPSWEFTDVDGNVWAMLAISDDYVDYRESR